jgi:hypothetical protein
MPSVALETGKAYELVFNYDTNAGALGKELTVTVEKQGSLANFKPIEDNTITTTLSATDTVTVTVPTTTPKGVYRIRFSMDDQSTNDDVYYTFIVEEPTGE